eukprot:TRINITY_DN2869_c0_g1_i1.p1 TRINITY_DN2869_c0_g1~~TRINITY_DN2869_c0_g1_i1.p1  ORF type:complete len:436 (+),score=81.08 TRINITY_DN2869_c0_g1_i1:109-1308(+)
MYSNNTTKMHIQDETEEVPSSNSYFRRFIGAIFKPINGLLLILLIFHTMVIVLLKRVSMYMTHYSYTLAQLQPVGSSFLFGTMFLISYFWKKEEKHEPVYSNLRIESAPLLDDDKPYLPPAPPSYFPSFTPPKIHMYTYLFLGILFTLSNFLLFSGSRGSYVPGPLSVLLQQSVIIFSFILSLVFLKKKFGVIQYIGALVTIGGIIVSLWPHLRESHLQDAKIWAIFLILGSTITTAAALTYMSHTITNKEMPFLYAWTCINIFETLAAVPLILAIVPMQGIPFSGMKDNVVDGFLCVFTGKNSLPGDTCQHIGWFFLAYIFFLVFGKLTLTYVLKHGSVVMGMVVLTCAVPLADILFTWGWLMGNDGKVTLSNFDIGGAGLVFIGLIMYRLTNEGTRH